MSHFRNQHAFSNWTGTAPGNNESAGKRKSGRTTHGNKTLKSTLTQCAKSAVKSKYSFFSAQYQRLASHRGKNRATMAVAHSMACDFLCSLRRGVQRPRRALLHSIQPREEDQFSHQATLQAWCSHPRRRYTKGFGGTARYCY
ncbi:transposase [Sporomusa termitida]|uniref:Transposase IS116/IS110/IS902 family protein n=1 Tax=Sporomusa termitida TaxID=2377 RepID=A0A517DSH9_9FIRM|nr:Transposase IS116/IS110/IS902 family protein [Sporomusa termitida]